MVISLSIKTVRDLFTPRSFMEVSTEAATSFLAFLSRFGRISVGLVVELPKGS